MAWILHLVRSPEDVIWFAFKALALNVLLEVTMEAALNALEPVRSFVSANSGDVLIGLVVATALLVLFTVTGGLSRRRKIRTLTKRLHSLQTDVQQLQAAANRSLLFRIRDQERISTDNPSLRDPPDAIALLAAKAAVQTRSQDAGTTV